MSTQNSYAQEKNSKLRTTNKESNNKKDKIQ